MMFMNSETVKSKQDYLNLLVHESSRVYADKFVDLDDVNRFNNILKDTITQKIPQEGPETVKDMQNFDRPILYSHFSQNLTEKKYSRPDDWPGIHKNLIEALDVYNESNAAMNLVLFEDAIKYVCQINRILESPRGNALLIGVGGSGKQSLAKLAASLAGLDVFQITLRKGYSMSDLKADIMELCLKVTVKNTPTMFLITDSQVI